jgi:hypothetical protein
MTRRPCIDQVDQRQVAARRDLLCAQDFLDGCREKCARFYRRIVGDDHAGAIMDVADAGDHPRGHGAADVFVHSKRRPQSDFEKRRFLVDEKLDALACGETPELSLPRQTRGATTFTQGCFLLRDLFRERPKCRGGFFSSLGHSLPG